jgi:hypothetical protein
MQPFGPHWGRGHLVECDKGSEDIEGEKPWALQMTTSILHGSGVCFVRVDFVGSKLKLPPRPSAPFLAISKKKGRNRGTRTTGAAHK